MGVFEEKGTSVTGQDQDDVIIIPWTTVQRKVLGIRWIKDMYISVSAARPLEWPSRKSQRCNFLYPLSLQSFPAAIRPPIFC